MITMFLFFVVFLNTEPMVVLVTCAAECGEEDLKEDLHCELQLDTRVTPVSRIGDVVCQ